MTKSNETKESHVGHFFGGDVHVVLSDLQYSGSDINSNPLFQSLQNLFPPCIPYVCPSLVCPECLRERDDAVLADEVGREAVERRGRDAGNGCRVHHDAAGAAVGAGQALVRQVSAVHHAHLPGEEESGARGIIGTYVVEISVNQGTLKVRESRLDWFA